MIIADRCPPDLMHCSCVPHLRREIARLTEERDAAIRSRDFTEGWYATRCETLLEWSRTVGYSDHVASVLANDGSPPTYAQLLALAGHRATRAERDLSAARAEVEEARLALAAEQGRQEGAPSSRWAWRGDHWQVGPDTDLEARAWPGGRLYLRDPKRICGTLSEHYTARAAMLAADAAQETP